MCVSAHDAFCEHGFLSLINYGAARFTRLWVSVREAIGELRPIRDFVSYGHAGFLLRPFLDNAVPTRRQKQNGRMPGGHDNVWVS